MYDLNNPRLQVESSTGADWKSTAVGNLFAFLLINVLAGHLVDGGGRVGQRHNLAPKRCRPQDFFGRCGNSCKNTRELIPFSHCTNRLTG